MGLHAIANVLKTFGPFDGIVGFSEGAAAAAMVASLLEDNRKDAFEQMRQRGGIAYPTAFASFDHPPLRFIVSFSGYAASHEAYRAFYDPPIRTPALHFIGTMDSVVDEAASMKLVENCQSLEETEAMVVQHSGGHVVPSERRELAVAVRFIKSSQGEDSCSMGKGRGFMVRVHMSETHRSERPDIAGTTISHGP